MSNPLLKPELNPPNETGGDCVCPIPCSTKAPLQHLREYVLEFAHKQALRLFFGELLPLVGPK